MEEEITRLQKELDKAHSERKVSQNEFLVCGNTMKIDILGTEYRIEIHKVSEDSYIKAERHHLLSNCPDDVNLIDVLEMISDCVCAGMARSGEVRDLEIDDNILKKAVNNTAQMIKNMIIVK